MPAFQETTKEGSIAACLVAVGLLNLLPVMGLFSADRLQNAYDVILHGPDLKILMQHRALLFGILGAYVLFAAFSRPHQNTAMAMAVVSMAGFVFLALTVPGHNDSILKVMLADIAGLLIIGIAIGLKLSLRKS